MKIKEVLMQRDGMSAEDADSLIKDARAELMELLEQGDMEGAENICADWFGLEPDYLDELY